MNRIWQAHWPPGLDEARIRLPGRGIGPGDRVALYLETASGKIVKRALREQACDGAG